MVAEAPVRRRLVCFLSGFDPRGPAHYHALYLAAAEQQGRLTGQSVRVGPRVKCGPHVATWRLTWPDESAETSTRYDFLRWDDLVRQHWPVGWWGAWRATAFASWHLWRDGVMWRALKTSWPSFVVMAAPGMLQMALALCLLAGVSACWWWPAASLPAALLGLLCGVVALGAVAQRVEAHAHMGWLSRSMASLVRQARGRAPEVEARLDEFAHHVARARADGGFDEVLVVGHSSGAMMAMSVVARALRFGGGPQGLVREGRFALLTLGHCAPILSGQPSANAFRADLATLVQAPQVDWVDYGAPPDGCCFPLVDPSADISEASCRPQLLNPRFADLFSQDSYRALRADHFRCHFQYLMAGELQTDYDYVAMTAGPLSLAQRHLGRASVTDFRGFQLWGGPNR